jgi:uncharacterized protein
MFMREFAETLIRNLIDHPEKMHLEVLDTGERILMTLKVDQADLGKIIGKKGRNAMAIRTLLTAIAAKQNKRVKFEVVEEIVP